MPTRPIKVWDGTAWIDVGVTAPSTTGFALTANNLSDVSSPSTALSNLGGTPTSRTITAGTGLTGGGDLSANRTLSVTGLTNAEIASNAAIASSKLADLPYSVTVTGATPPVASLGSIAAAYLASSIYNFVVGTNGLQDRYFEWNVWLAAGTYTLRTMWRALTTGGIASISIDGAAALGTTIDMYAATAASNNITDITGISLTAGIHTIRYTASTKNASSSGYILSLHGFVFSRTGA